RWVVPLSPSTTLAPAIDRTRSVLPPPPQTLAGAAEFRATGVTTSKSAPLSSLSWQPFSLRIAPVELESTAVGALPSYIVALPEPTRSTIIPCGDGEQGRGVPVVMPQARSPVSASTILPLVPPIVAAPSASGVGSPGRHMLLPAAICTR